jgi:hypothetical protein
MEQTITYITTQIRIHVIYFLGEVMEQTITYITGLSKAVVRKIIHCDIAVIQQVVIGHHSLPQIHHISPSVWLMLIPVQASDNC